MPESLSNISPYYIVDLMKGITKQILLLAGCEQGRCLSCQPKYEHQGEKKTGEAIGQKIKFK